MNVVTPSIPEAAILWRFAKLQRHAYCTLAPHPDGFQLRYVFNGAVLIGMVSPDHGQLLERARQWRLRLVADGWIETEQDRSVMGHLVRPRALAHGSGA